MRRTSKITNLSIIFLTLAGIFNLLSFALDQQVVQQEDKIRDLNRELQFERTKLESLTYSLNTLEDLRYTTSRSVQNFFSSLDFNAKVAQIFNPYSPTKSVKEKSSKQDVIKLNEIYKVKLHELVDKVNIAIDETEKIFTTNFSSGTAYEFVKDDIAYKSLLEFREMKIPKNIFEEYNFDKEVNDSNINKNYDIYHQFNASLNDIYYLEVNFENLLKKIKPYYINIFAAYFDYLDFYAAQKNRKNFYILSSIVAQILGITFFLLLFRSILKARAKE